MAVSGDLGRHLGISGQLLPAQPLAGERRHHGAEQHDVHELAVHELLQRQRPQRPEPFAIESEGEDCRDRLNDEHGEPADQAFDHPEQLTCTDKRWGPRDRPIAGLRLRPRRPCRTIGVKREVSSGLPLGRDAYLLVAGRQFGRLADEAGYDWDSGAGPTA